MAFTVNSVERGPKQFQGAFKEMWQVSATKNFASLAAGAEDTDGIAVPGVEFGDMVLGMSWDVTPNVKLDWSAYVTAAGTVTVRITNLDASVAVDLPQLTMKILVGRPSW